MRVKRFVAQDIQEAMAKIKTEMGNDAVILHTRYFKEGGILGLFRRNYVEVTAATDDSTERLRGKIISPGNGLFALEREVTGEPLWEDNSISEKAINPVNPRIDSLVAPSKNPVKQGVQGAPNDPLHSNITQELTEMKTIMSEMSNLIEESSQISNFPKLGQNLYQRLCKQDIEGKIAKKIVKQVLQQLAIQPQHSDEHINSLLLASLLKPLKKTKALNIGPRSLRKPKIFAFVGPTGVGKTTTIAKIAAMQAIMENKKVAFLTIDTYRIAAVEQLRTIGEIMNVPVSVVYSLNQLNECLLELSDNEIIFIDTAGRSHKNTNQMKELKNYLEMANTDEIFLVLSSTGKYQDLLDILSAYQEFNITKLIFTKLDETSSYGAIYNIAHTNKYPLSYFTTGQNIPDDIETADVVKLVQLLMKEKYHE